MIFVATLAERLTMNHRDESNYNGAAPSHPEEAAAHGLNVRSRLKPVRAHEGEYQSRSALILTGLAPVSCKRIYYNRLRKQWNLSPSPETFPQS
jgi:hypothetical protein